MEPNTDRRRMRILVPLSELAGVTQYTGGIGRGYAATLPHLPPAGVDVTVLLIADSPVERDAERIPAVTLEIRTWLLRVPASLRPAARALAFAVESRLLRHDAVYAPEWQGTAAWASRRRPLVTNLAASLDLIRDTAGADGRARSDPRRALELVQRALERRQIRRSTLVVPCSSAIRDWNLRFFGARLPPTVVVRNCIDVDRVGHLAGTAELPPGWPPGSRVVLYAGRLEMRKGVDVAVRAFSRIAGDHPDVEFVFAGGTGDLTVDPSVDDLCRSVPDEARSRFRFLGHTAAEPLYAAMRAALFVVCPSRWEAFGNIVLEARSAGSAVVVTTGSGFDDFCTDGVDAVMVAPGDAEALEVGCRRLLEDDDLRKRIAEEGQRGLGRFRGESVAHDLASVLRSATAGVAER